MSTVHFMSRASFEVWYPSVPTAYISINAPGHSVPRATAGLWVAGLAWFREDDSNPVPPHEVEMLVSFIETWRDNAFVVHCAAGISRSAAVALYIGALLERQVIGIDSDGLHANAVIKAALMQDMWYKQFREPAMSKVLEKLPDYVSCIMCTKTFKPQAFGHEVCWECCR